MTNDNEDKLDARATIERREKSTVERHVHKSTRVQRLEHKKEDKILIH